MGRRPPEGATFFLFSFFFFRKTEESDVKAGQTRKCFGWLRMLKPVFLKTCSICSVKINMFFILDTVIFPSVFWAGEAACPGSREVRMGQNCGANPMETLLDQR